jgi:hypothetical protein
MKNRKDNIRRLTHPANHYRKLGNTLAKILPFAEKTSSRVECRRIETPDGKTVLIRKQVRVS